MFSRHILTASLFGIISTAGMAQTADPNYARDVKAGLEHSGRDSAPASNKASNIEASNTKSMIAPTLPTPPLRTDAGAREFLQAARASLVAGRTGEAQQALEMAQTRALNGEVPQERASIPNSSLFIIRIRDALHSLASGDSGQAFVMIDSALAG